LMEAAPVEGARPPMPYAAQCGDPRDVGTGNRSVPGARSLQAEAAVHR